MPKALKKRPAAKRRRNRHQVVPSHRLIKPDIVRVSPPAERPWELDQEQVRILKNSICKGATDNELEYCLTVARRYKLDPFKQQIWFIKRWDKSADDGRGGHGAFVWTPQVGIYGMAHIAARDHRDYGSFSRAEYGPMIEVEVEGKKIKGPEWCIVKAWKKNAKEPSIGEAYLEEYCPRRWENTLFWRTMPHRMIAKCAKAQAIREAYPETGGLYIPEECENFQGNYTPEGRQIVYPEQQRALDDNAAHGWPVGSEQARQAEASLARVEAADRELESSRKPLETPSRAAQPPQRRTKNEQAGTLPDQGQEGPSKRSGTIEIDYADPASPIVRGDLSNVLPMLQKHCTMEWKAPGWWHCLPKDVVTIRQMCVELSFDFKEVRPKASAHDRAETTTAAGQGSGGVQPAAPVVVGTIERSIAAMAGKYPVRQVTLVLADKTKPTVSCFDKKWFKELDGGLGKLAKFEIKENKGYQNIAAVLRIGGKEWLSDGTPVVQKDREPGSLFK